MISAETRDWLLDGDPAIRWQVMSDLLDGPAAEAKRERARVATRGWGKDLLARQDPAGTWANGIYSRKWVSTTYTLLLLWRLGLPRNNQAARNGCAALWDGVVVDGGVSTKNSTVPPDICISAFWLTLSAYFGYRDGRIPGVVEWVLEGQLDDGGWNCEAMRTGSRHGSFHTTIQVLDALAEIADTALEPAAARGREFLLDHRMYRSHRTGAVANRAFTMLSFPPRWHYDVLRGLDHFRFVGADVDDRMDDALALLHAEQRKDGRWPVQNKHQGLVWFDMESGRQPSRWNTLRALRVLDWAGK